MSFMRPFLLGPVFFWTTLPCSGGYHIEMGGMPLHDVTGINCKNGTTTENQGSAVKYMAKRCILMTVCVRVLLLECCLPFLCVLSGLT